MSSLCLGFALLGVALAAGAARGQVITEFSTGITAGARPTGIAAGPDGNLWFAEQSGNRIGRVAVPLHAIPNLGEFGLLALAGLLAAGGLGRLRRSGRSRRT